VDVYSHIFLPSTLVGGEWPASRPGRFIPGERASGTRWIGDWVGPRTGMGDVEKRKFLILPGLKLQPLGRPACSQSLYRLRYLGSFAKWMQLYFLEAPISNSLACQEWASVQLCFKEFMSSRQPPPSQVATLKSWLLPAVWVSSELHQLLSTTWHVLYIQYITRSELIKHVFCKQNTRISRHWSGSKQRSAAGSATDSLSVNSWQGAIWGYHIGEYEHNYLLGCDTVCLLDAYWRFGGPYCLCLQGYRVSQTSSRLSPLSAYFLACSPYTLNLRMKSACFSEPWRHISCSEMTENAITFGITETSREVLTRLLITLKRWGYFRLNAKTKPFTRFSYAPECFHKVASDGQTFGWRIKVNRPTQENWHSRVHVKNA
jgi:hypothetical protein